MVRNESQHDSDEKPQLVGESDQSDDIKRAVPAWIISFVVHLVVLGMLSLIVYAAKQEIDEPAIKNTVVLPHPPDVEPIIPPKDPHEPDPNIQIPEISDKPSPFSSLETPVEEFSSDDQDDAKESLGREDAKADMEMGREGLAMVIGPGANDSGKKGRGKGGKKRSLGKYGGTLGTECAVNAALNWFKRHQSPNGQWDVDGYMANCQENPKCEPGTAHTDERGDIAATGYALMCFLSSGYDHRMPSRYKRTVKNGLDWLVSVQKADGAWGSQNYELGIAVMAIADAYAMSNDPALRGPAQKGIDTILRRQVPDKSGGYGLAWSYDSPVPTRLDSSVSGWCVMALKSAASAGLEVGNGLEGSKLWLKNAWKAANPTFVAHDPYSDESGFPYTWNGESGATDGQPSRAPIGALCAVFLNHQADDPMLNSLANYIVNHQMPAAFPTNLYYLYYNTMAMFQVGGPRWTKWNGVVRDALVGAQRKGNDCFAGSWDSAGSGPTENEGRLFSTAYCCLSLEVYYKEDRIFEGKKH